MKKFLISAMTAYALSSSFAQGADVERLKRRKPSYEASGVKVYELTPQHTRGVAVAATSTIHVPLESIRRLLATEPSSFDQWVPNLKSVQLIDDGEQTSHNQQKNAILTGVYRSIFRLHSMIWDIDAYTRFKIENKDITVRNGQNNSQESWYVISAASMDRPLLPNFTRGSLDRLEIWLKQNEDPKQTDVMISFDVLPGWLPPVSVERLKKGYLVQLIKAIERHSKPTQS